MNKFESFEFEFVKNTQKFQRENTFYYEGTGQDNECVIESVIDNTFVNATILADDIHTLRFRSTHPHTYTPPNLPQSCSSCGGTPILLGVEGLHGGGGNQEGGWFREVGSYPTAHMKGRSRPLLEIVLFHFSYFRCH